MRMNIAFVVFIVALHVLLLAQYAAEGRLAFYDFFGTEKYSMFDLWTLEHFLGGICFMYLINHKDFPKSAKILVGLSLMTIWEVIEYWIETDFFGGVYSTRWCSGVEHWSNRLVSDPLVFFLGALIEIKKVVIWGIEIKKDVIGRSVVAVYTAWYAINLFMPHNMYVQEFFVAQFSG